MERLYLVLCPQNIPKNQGVIEILRTWKETDGWKQAIEPLTNSNLHYYFPSASKEAIDTILAFSEQACLKRIQELEQRHNQARAGITFQQYYPQALMRELRKTFGWIKPIANQFPWYYRVWKNAGSQRTAPCQFAAYQPSLRFAVTETNGHYTLQTSITTAEGAFALEDWECYSFCCIRERSVYLLSHADWQTLQWLNQQPWDELGANPAQFEADVILELEKTYPVERGLLGEANTIHVDPDFQVLVREISKQFLLLTPQWIYDGITVEGAFREKEEVRHTNGLLRIVRTKERELPLMQQVESLHPSFAKQRSGNYHLSFADAQKKQWFYKAYHQLLSWGISVVGMDLLEHFRYSAEIPITDIELVHTEQHVVTLRFEVQFGKEKIRLHELQQAIVHGQRNIPLKDGSMGVLPSEWIQQYVPLLKHGKIQDGLLLVPRWLLFVQKQAQTKSDIPTLVDQLFQASSSSQVISLSNPAQWWKRWQHWQEQEEPLLETPSRLKATLRPYQQKGLEWLCLLSEIGAGGILADDMGLGKTLQAIAFVCQRLEQDSLACTLIVCPTSLLYNWQQEWQRYAPAVPVLIYHGQQRELPESTDSGTVVLSTYGTMRSDIDALATRSWDTVVLDESHNIKNPAAQITRASNQLQAIHRLALSGTPVMNNTFDLFAQVHFVLPGMLGSREFFRREYADPIDRFQDEEKKAMLHQITQPFILRRTKEQVAPELPEKTEQIMWCELGQDQRLAYNTIREHVRSSVFLDINSKGIQEGKLAVINGLLKLRQVCNAHELLPVDLALPFESIKVNILLNELSQLTAPHKALVFSQFTAMLDVLEEPLHRAGISFLRIDGQIPAAQRQERVDQFQKREDISVMLISLKAGNAGLNLTAADYVFLIDPWWNTAVEQQAIDRTHRIGQQRKVFAYRLICRNTIEEKILQLQERKKQLADDLVGEEVGFVKSLTEDDIQFLLSD